MEPTGFDTAVSLLTRLAMHFWQPDRPMSHFDPLIEDYGDDLAGYPLDVLQEAMAVWRRREKWFPKVSELLTICEEVVGPRSIRLARLERMLWRQALPDHRPRRYKDLSEEEKAAHERMMRDAGFRPVEDALPPMKTGEPVIDGILGMDQ